MKEFFPYYSVNNVNFGHDVHSSIWCTFLQGITHIHKGAENVFNDQD